MSILKVFTGIQNPGKFIPSLGEVCVFSYIQVVLLENRPH